MVGRENKDRELKQAITNTFLKTVSAYANYEGGDIVFGVTDDGAIVGINNPEQAALVIENSINDSIKPRPEYQIDLDENTNVLTLHVSEGINKPYLYKNKAYKRNDAATVEVDINEFRRLIMEGENLCYDELITTQEILEFNVLKKWLKESLQVTDVTNDILKTLGLLTKKDEYTNAGAIVSDVNIYLGVDLARFGKSINEILDRETHDQISVLKMYSRALAMFERYYCYEVIEGYARVVHMRIPEEAFRETIANALVHRRWDVKSRVRIEMYEDRIEVTSPGGLPNGVSIADYLDGQISLMRNPVIGSLFFRLNLIENFGTGIRRIKAVYEPYEVIPDFVVTDNAVRVVLPVIDSQILLSVDESSVVDVIKRKGSSTSKDIAATLGFGKDKTLKLLRSLIEKKRIEQIGAGRSTHYQMRR